VHPVKVPGKDTTSVVTALIREVQRLPAALRDSLTWDRGLELAQHHRFTVATDMAVYFCDPRSPWQCGTTGNTNGLLRQYFPDGTDRSVFTQRDPNQVALNSVRTLASEDVRREREMITQLAALLRHTLVNHPFAAVPLQEELEIIATYLAIEQVRHEEALQVRFEIADDVREIRLPGFLLHPLVENAITHGFATPGTLLRITVRARREGRQLIIEVVNSGALGTDRADGSGIGLRNIRERLAHLYGDRSSVIVEEAQGEVVARIRIPLDHLEAWA
jgi:hypothetical protein